MNYCNPEGWKNEVRNVRETLTRDQFFTYFDGPRGGSVDQAFEKAEDVFNRLMLPQAKKFFKTLRGKTCLDIGYGSGGQVAAASKWFSKCIGIEVHGEQDIILEELNRRGIKEFELWQTDGSTIPLNEDEIDFVFSWVTFIHLPTISYIKEYLKECYRIMKDNAVGVIFFGRLLRSKKDQKWEEVLADIEKEKSLPEAYREGGPHSPVKSICISMSMWKMEELVTDAGFVVRDYTASSDGFGPDVIYHGQYGIVFSKPAKSKMSIRRRATAKK